MYRYGIFSGTLQNIAVYNANFVHVNVGWDNLGVGLYLPEAAYCHVLDHSMVYGFEKAGYFGDAYVLSMMSPRIIRNRYGFQLDTANGATIHHTDATLSGYGTIPQQGWVYYLRGGNGANISGGNISNGGFNIPVICDRHNALCINGVYTEANHSEMIHVINHGSAYIDTWYAKEPTTFGRTINGGILHINNVNFELVAYEYVVNSDDTGSWSLTNARNARTGQRIPDKRGIGSKRYELPVYTGNDSGELYPTRRIEKTVPDATLTNLFKIQTQVTAIETDITVGVVFDYTFAGEYGGGYVSEKGTLDIILHHRFTLSPKRTVSKGHSVQVVSTNTLTLTFDSTVVDLGGGRFETTINILSADSAGNSGLLTGFLKASTTNRVDDHDYGTIKLL
jgi:hypothetical protein